MLGLFDARVDVYRISQTPNSLGEVVEKPVLVHESVRCTIQMSQSQSRDESAGSRPGGFAICFIDKKKDYQDQDIFHVVSGPNTGKWWHINGEFEPTNARWHKEFRIQPYIGPRP